MTDIKKPNADQSNNGDMTGVFSEVFRALKMEMDDMLPAKVISYDDSTNRASVQPMVMQVATDGTRISRPVFPNLPVFRFGGGGFFIRFPIKPGDLGWIKASDRDISLFFQRGCEEDQPNTERIKSFSDAFFIPDTMREWVISGANADALVVQSMDGSVCLSLHAGKAVLDSPLVEVNAPQTIYNGEIEVNGNVVIKGNHSIEGNSSSTGGTMTHNGVNIGSSHTHGGVETGGGTTGTPS